MKINKDTIIKCDNIEEVKDCLNKLDILGFNIDFTDLPESLVISICGDNTFFNNDYSIIHGYNNLITHKELIEYYNDNKDKLSPNLIVDKNEKILKINNINKNYTVFYYAAQDDTFIKQTLRGCHLEEYLQNRDYYISHKACEKAVKKNRIRKKLELLAFELNGNRDINWNDGKDKYCICYNVFCHTICVDNITKMKDMNFYCYSKDFKNKAIELVGEEDLKDYLMNC